MSTCQNFLDDLNDRLNDIGNSQATELAKIRWLNNGIAAMWPKLYKTVRDSTLVIASNTYEYPLPATVGTNTKILRIEVESASGSSRFVDVSDTDLVPGLTDAILVFRGSGLPGSAGSKIRVTAAKKITAFATNASTYDGPEGSEELPVLYAMAVATGRRLDDKVDHRRYNSTQANGVVTVNEMMDVSQSFLAQFELLLDRMSLPLPSPAG